MALFTTQKVTCQEGVRGEVVPRLILCNVVYDSGYYKMSNISKLQYNTKRKDET